MFTFLSIVASLLFVRGFVFVAKIVAANIYLNGR